MEFKEVETNKDTKTPNDFLTLSYIEYNPGIIQEFSSTTVNFYGDYPDFSAKPYMVEANFSRDPSDYADVRQYVRKSGVSLNEEITGNEKYRWFPASVISDNLLTYQKYLNNYDKRVGVNNLLIQEYNKVVNGYQLLLNAFNRAKERYYKEDDERVLANPGE